MATQIEQKSNTTVESEFPPGYLEANTCCNKVCEKIIPIALIAIASLITGGSLLYCQINTIAAGLLIGFGSVLVVGDVIYSVKISLDFKKELKSQ